jgi:hypothetical protein
MVIGFIYFGNCEVGFWLSGEGHFGVYEKLKLVKLNWWALDHVDVMCCAFPSILTRFWTQGVTAVQLD